MVSQKTTTNYYKIFFDLNPHYYRQKLHQALTNKKSKPKPNSKFLLN